MLRITHFYQLMVLWVFFLPLQLEAQDYPSIYQPSDKNELGILPGNLIQLSNYYEDQIVFDLSFNKRDWKSFVLYKGRPMLIDLKKNTKAYFKLCTGSDNNCLNQEVEGSNRYRVYFNKYKRKWDLQKKKKQVSVKIKH